MIVENYEEKKEEVVESYCLFERFGRGVHLIKDKGEDSFKLMLIRNKRVAVLFLDDDNFITYAESKNNKIIYEEFDDFYYYIKKLEPKEIIIKLKGDEK